MSNCEICGKKTSKLFKTIIEGTDMNVCQECTNFGRVISKPATQSIRVKEKSEKKPEVEEIIVKDFAVKIRKVRQQEELTQDEFAKELNEKLSVIKNIEAGKLVPDLKLAKKIENMYEITLIEELGEVRGGLITEKSSIPTLGDMIKIKKRKK